jgi:hypothetical protein
MAGKPYQSCLIPYGNEIITLRRKKPPTPYPRIAALLYEQYQIAISCDGIREFVKRRANKDTKTCKFAWKVNLPEANDPPVMETKTIKPKASKPPDKPARIEEDDDFEIPKFSEVMQYSDTYNLTLMSPEEAAALEERIRRKKERDRTKEKQ